MDDEPEVAENAGLGDDSAEDRKAAKKGFFPSSMGLSFLVAADVDSLEVVVRWGDYRRVETEDDGSVEHRGDEEAGEVEARRGQPEEGGEEEGGEARGAGQGAGEEPRADDRSARSWWQRISREEPVAVALPVVATSPRPYPVPNSGGLSLHVVARPVNAAGFAGRIAPGTRSVSLFLVNNRTVVPEQERDVTFAFQAEIEVRSATPFVPRPDPREVSGEDWDERVADLALRPYPRVRGRSRRFRGLGDGGRHLPDPPDDLDPRRRRGEDGDLRRAGSGARHGRPRRTCRRFRSRGRALAARDSVPIVDRGPACRPWRACRRSFGGGPRDPAPRGGRRGPDGARHPCLGGRFERTRRLPHREPCRRCGALASPRSRRRWRSGAPLAGLSARLHPPESPRHRGPGESGSRVRRSPLLSHGWRQDRGISRSCRVHHGPPPPPQSGRPGKRGAPRRSRGQRHHALYPAAADPRSARTRSRLDVCA